MFKTKLFVNLPKSSDKIKRVSVRLSYLNNFNFENLDKFTLWQKVSFTVIHIQQLTIRIYLHLNHDQNIHFIKTMSKSKFKNFF